MLNLANDRLAFRVQHRFERQVLRIEQRIIFRLPIIRVDRLLKITLAVEQADADKAKAKVAGGFRMVAGKHPQAARGDGQRLMKTKFRREIGDRIFTKPRRVFVRPGGFVVEVSVEIA
jgi:hypothetical protein